MTTGQRFILDEIYKEEEDLLSYYCEEYLYAVLDLRMGGEPHADRISTHRRIVSMLRYLFGISNADESIQWVTREITDNLDKCTGLEHGESVTYHKFRARAWLFKNMLIKRVQEHVDEAETYDRTG